MEKFISYTFFGSEIAFILFVIALFIALIISDIGEKGNYALTIILIAILLNYYWGTFPIMSIISVKNIIIYLFAGFIFSLIRTFFKGKKLTPETKQNFKLKEHVFRWWLLFPICAINWIFGDLLKDLFEYIYSKLNRLYEWIFNV